STATPAWTEGWARRPPHRDPAPAITIVVSLAGPPGPPDPPALATAGSPVGDLHLRARLTPSRPPVGNLHDGGSFLARPAACRVTDCRRRDEQGPRAPSQGLQQPRRRERTAGTRRRPRTRTAADPHGTGATPASHDPHQLALRQRRGATEVPGSRAMSAAPSCLTKATGQRPAPSGKELPAASARPVGRGPLLRRHGGYRGGVAPAVHRGPGPALPRGGRSAVPELGRRDPSPVPAVHGGANSGRDRRISVSHSGVAGLAVDHPA